MAKYNIVEKKEKEASYRSMVSEQVMRELQEGILEVIINQKKFKDKNYSAKRLAEDLGTNTRYISAVVNVKFGMNYTSFVNSFRIKEALAMLTESRYYDMKMQDISDYVGFSNRQSFYASFFKTVKMTPREYRKRYLDAHPDVAEKIEAQKTKKRRARKNRKKRTNSQ